MNTCATYVPGPKLTESQRRHVLSCYVHRFTGDHRPAWISIPRPNGKPYPLQFASDADWLANTEFPVLPNGGIKGDCYSRPTWPSNPELR